MVQSFDFLVLELKRFGDDIDILCSVIIIILHFILFFILFCLFKKLNYLQCLITLIIFCTVNIWLKPPTAMEKNIQ